MAFFSSQVMYISFTCMISIVVKHALRLIYLFYWIPHFFMLNELREFRFWPFQLIRSQTKLSNFVRFLTMKGCGRGHIYIFCYIAPSYLVLVTWLNYKKKHYMHYLNHRYLKRLNIKRILFNTYQKQIKLYETTISPHLRFFYLLLSFIRLCCVRREILWKMVYLKKESGMIIQ